MLAAKIVPIDKYSLEKVVSISNRTEFDLIDEMAGWLEGKDDSGLWYRLSMIICLLSGLYLVARGLASFLYT